MKQEPFVTFCGKASWELEGNCVGSVGVWGAPTGGTEYILQSMDRSDFIYLGLYFPSTMFVVFAVQALHFFCSLYSEVPYFS